MSTQVSIPQQGQSLESSLYSRLTWGSVPLSYHWSLSLCSLRKTSPLSLGPSSDNESLDPKFLPVIYLSSQYISLLLDWGSDLFSVLFILHLTPSKIRILPYMRSRRLIPLRITSYRFLSCLVSSWANEWYSRLEDEKRKRWRYFFSIPPCFSVPSLAAFPHNYNSSFSSVTQFLTWLC